MTAALLAIMAAAMLLVRVGWGAARRRHAAAAGWALAIGALVVLTMRDGAWGLAVGTVAAMAMACGIVLYAGWRSPPGARRAARAVPSIVIPHRWGDVLHRLAVFVLVVPGAFAAAAWLAFGTQALARRGGFGDADAIVTMLFLQPVAWTVVMTIQMTRTHAGAMIAPPVAAAAIGTILWTAA